MIPEAELIEIRRNYDLLFLEFDRLLKFRRSQSRGVIDPFKDADIEIGPLEAALDRLIEVARGKR